MDMHNIPPWPDNMHLIPWPEDMQLMPGESDVRLNQAKWNRDKETIQSTVNKYLTTDRNALIQTDRMGTLNMEDIGGPHILYPWYIIMYIIQCFGEETINVFIPLLLSPDFPRIQQNMHNFMGLQIASSRGNRWEHTGFQKSVLFTHPSLGGKLYSLEWNVNRPGSYYFILQSLIVHTRDTSDGHIQNESEGYQAVLHNDQNQELSARISPSQDLQSTIAQDLETRILKTCIFDSLES